MPVGRCPRNGSIAVTLPYAGGTILECGYRLRLQATPAEVWKPIVSLGGKNGYFFGNALWKLRGGLDRLLGGIGFRGGRRHPTELRVGDALDFWRVLEVEPEKRLMLLAEMKLPGDAILEFTLTPVGPNLVEIQELSRFLPRGLVGILYWYSVYPLHNYIFGGMLTGLARKIGRPVVSGPEALHTQTAPGLPGARDQKPEARGREIGGQEQRLTGNTRSLLAE